MDEALTAAADERFAEAIAATGARDPRDFYRERLRTLKPTDQAAYSRAVEYYHETLIPRVASPDSDPLAEWRAYGLFLAELVAEGRTVDVDPTGKATPYEHPGSADGLVLHIPDGKGRALLVGLPPTLSPAQKATHDWLVAGRNKLPGA